MSEREYSEELITNAAEQLLETADPEKALVAIAKILVVLEHPVNNKATDMVALFSVLMDIIDNIKGPGQDFNRQVAAFIMLNADLKYAKKNIQ